MNNGQISAQSQGIGRAGDLSIQVVDLLNARDGEILTAARTDGGNLALAARDVRLAGNSNIRTDVANGAGGNITIRADSILAFDDSDILAFAQQGRGGNITLDTSAFFGKNYQPSNINLQLLDGNNRADINASGTVSGVITLPDANIQNNLSQLPQNAIDTNTLLANTCITRNSQNGSFHITGTGGLPINPGEVSNYSTEAIQPTTWKRGDVIVEPQGDYLLPNGQLVMSRECD